jgi:hypothetical protein
MKALGPHTETGSKAGQLTEIHRKKKLVGLLFGRQSLPHETLEFRCIG